MPPTRVHFNGSINLADAATVMREITTRVPSGVRRIPDGETGDRQNWIFFQLQKFLATSGLEQAATGDTAEADYGDMPKVRLADGADPDTIDWPNLGYADAYLESYATFRELRDQGVVSAGTRFQVQYPTPLASISAWVVPEQQERVEPSYERSLLADLARLLVQVPHEDVAVQWDVASEFALLTEAWERVDAYSFDRIVERLARCVDEVPADVPVGLHLCYGDYGHRHFAEPESLAAQVRVANQLTGAAGRPISWFSFTVPQYQRDAAYFAPLRELRPGPDTELYFGIVPYHPAEQDAGTTAEQVRLIDENLSSDRTWGVNTECGMGRVATEDVPVLLDLHHEIVARHGG